MYDPLLNARISLLAVIAFILLLSVNMSFFVSPGAWWADYPGILFHLVMFIVVAKLPAPDWAKAAGYGWLFLDVTTGVMTLNHVPLQIAMYVRLGGHIFGGIWMVVASLSGSRAMKIVGVVAGTWLAGYSFASPFVSMMALGPDMILYLVWLAIVARDDRGAVKAAEARIGTRAGR